MKLKDWQVRALKTFVQAFGGVLVPEICLILNNGLPPDITAASKILFPVFSAALAAGISAGWNAILENTRSKDISVTFTCDECKSSFQVPDGSYELYMLTKKNTNGFSTLIGTRKTVNCPKCGKECTVVEFMNGAK